MYLSRETPTDVRKVLAAHDRGVVCAARMALLHSGGCIYCSRVPPLSGCWEVAKAGAARSAEQSYLPSETIDLRR
jgi:hypothetical protein